MRRLLNPRNDLVFKKVFGTEKNKNILITFLNDIFDGVHDTIKDVKFLKLHQNTEIALLRQSIVDVLCENEKGNKFIIEMQCASDSSFIKRASAYACRVYLNQRLNTDKSTSDYKDMKPVVFFAIMERSLFKNKKAYLSHHKFQDICTGECDIKDFSFSFLELGKFSGKFSKQETNIGKWAYFFKHAQDTTPEELEQIVKDYPVVGDAYTALNEYGFTPEELLEYERYEMKTDEISTSLKDAKAEGIAQGKAEGIAEGIAEGELKKAQEAAKRMLSDGMSTASVSKYTGLSEEEVVELQKSIK